MPNCFPKCMYQCSFPSVPVDAGSCFSFFFFLNPQLRICSLIWDGGGEGEREREISISCILYTPWPRLHTKPKYVPWPGIEPPTFGVQDDPPTNWATWPGRWLYFSVLAGAWYGQLLTCQSSGRDGISGWF